MPLTAASGQGTSATLYAVRVEEGRRTTAGGDKVAYALYIPLRAPGLPEPPWPAVVLTHGFARTHRFHRYNAHYMAQRGIVVLTPDMVSLAPERNVANTANHAAWLAARSRASSDTLAGLVDPARIGLAGHSAGGAVALEAAVASQADGTTAAAVCLLDAVPWNGTMAAAPRLKKIPFACLRSELGVWNAHGRILALLPRLGFPAEDVKIVRSTHADPENPTDLPATLACGGTTSHGRALYQRLMYLFFKDTLQGPAVERPAETYRDALQRLEAEGKVAVQAIERSGAQ